MKYPIFYNSEIQIMLKKYSEKQTEYLIKGIIKQPYEIMKEIKNER